MKKFILFFVVPCVVIALLGVGFVNWCWKNRETDETRREARRAVVRELREMPNEQVVQYLKDLFSKKTLHVWFVPSEDGEECPRRFWTLRGRFATRVPYDFIAQQTENMIIRFAGNDTDKPRDIPRIKQLIAFSE